MITLAMSLLGNLTYSKMPWLPVLCPVGGKIPMRVKAFPGETGAAAGTSAQEGRRNCSSTFCHSCQSVKERLTVQPQTGSRGATIDLEWLNMSEKLSCPSKETPTPLCNLKNLYWACVHNDPTELQARLDAGVSPEEASQVDSNGRVRCLRA